MNKLSVICVALLLSACGGGSSNNASTVPPPTPTPATEAFFVRVLADVGQAPEETEAVDISAVAVSEPEDTEPPAI